LFYLTKLQFFSEKKQKTPSIINVGSVFFRPSTSYLFQLKKLDLLQI